MFLEVLKIIAPVLTLAMIGFIWEKLKQPYDTAFVTRLALNVAGPCLVFSTLAQVRLPPESFAMMALAGVAMYAVNAVAAALVLAIAGLSMRAFLPPLLFGNTGNVGLPLCLFAFGEPGLALAMIVFAVSTILMIGATSWITSGQAAPWKGLQEPMVLAAFFGAAASLGGLSLPDWTLDTLSLIGQIMIPMMLLTLGVSIARLELARVDRAILLSLARLGIGFAAGLAAAELLALEGVARGVVILQAMTPTAVLNYLFAERYEVEPTDVAGLVVLSTAMSVLAFPTVLAMLI